MYADPKLEEMILSAALVNSDAAQAVACLPVDTFTSSSRLAIHGAIRTQVETGGSPSVAAVYSAIDREYSADLLSITTDQASSLGWKAALEKALYLRASRRVQSLTSMTKEVLEQHGPEAAMEFLWGDIPEVFAGVTPQVETMAGVQEDVLRGVEHLPFGIHDLDTEILGIPMQYCVTIGARPSVGKTALALTLMNTWARRGNTVYMFSLETKIPALARRIISAESGVDGAALRTGRMTEADRIRATDAWRRMQTQLKSLVINDRDRQYSKIMSEAHKAVTQLGTKVFVLDHIGLIQGLPRRERRDLQIGEFMSNVAAFTKNHDCIWINLCQLTRGAEGEKPVLSDLREAGQIEQDSDMVILLNRDRHADSKFMEVDIAKFRDGKVIDRKVYFDTTTMKIGDVQAYASRYGRE